MFFIGARLADDSQRLHFSCSSSGPNQQYGCEAQPLLEHLLVLKQAEWIVLAFRR